MNNKVLGLILARGGSVGVPRKNIRLLAGKPVLAYTIESARRAKKLDRVIVTTDDMEIADIARFYGAEVPFIRPKELAQAGTTDWPVFIHALETLKKLENYEPDVVVHLRPTNPCRTSEQIDAGVLLLEKHPEADSVRSVSTPAQNPYKMWRDKNGYLVPLLVSDIPEAYNAPRQTLPIVLWQNGYVDLAWRRTFVEKKSMTGDKIVPLVLEDAPWIDIDSPESFRLAEAYFQASVV